ncbi:MAG: YgiT-type zinc finger protein [Clostridia bacterium]
MLFEQYKISDDKECKIMIEKVYVFICDRCGETFISECGRLETAIEDARLKGWVVSRDRRGSFCPKHASSARSVGCHGNHTLFR